MKYTTHYLQYNLNGEHSCEDNVSIGQDLEEKHKGLLSNVAFFCPLVQCVAAGVIVTWFL